MNLNTLSKRHSKQIKVIERRIKRRARWILRFPKSSYADYLKVLIVEDREQLDAISSAFVSNLKRRRKILEQKLTEDMPDKKKQKFQEEYDELVDIMWLPNREY